jgi:hypothetical protein
MGWTLNESLLSTTATAGDTTATFTAAATADTSNDTNTTDADVDNSQEQQQAACSTATDSQSVGTAKHAVRGWKSGFTGEDKARLTQLESELSFEDIMLFRAMAERVSV